MVNYEKDGFGNSTGIALFSSVAMSEDKTAFSLPAIEKVRKKGMPLLSINLVLNMKVAKV
ncbi:hypothetical protein I3679_016055 [Proteus mirabilis]|uniref:Uncharacterized protein n=1 Tax=Proteus mirabilis TaxID=584 RepID=A0ABD5LWW8_PROMI